MLYLFQTITLLFQEIRFLSSIDDVLTHGPEFHHAVVSNQSYFDDITYEGGGAVLRMLEAIMGSDVYYAALNSYLTQYAYMNADQNNLIHMFEKVRCFWSFNLPIQF